MSKGQINNLDMSFDDFIKESIIIVEKLNKSYFIPEMGKLKKDSEKFSFLIEAISMICGPVSAEYISKIAPDMPINRIKELHLEAVNNFYETVELSQKTSEEE